MSRCKRGQRSRTARTAKSPCRTVGFGEEPQRSQRKGMRTTDFTDNTDEEQRQISTGEFIPPLGRMRSHAADLNQFAIPPKGGFKAISHPLFNQWNRCDPWSLDSSFLLRLSEARPCRNLRGSLFDCRPAAGHPRSFGVDDFLQPADGTHPEHLHGRARAAHAFGDFIERQTLEVAEDDHLLVVLGEL